MRFFIYSLSQGNYSEKIGKDTDNEYFDELKAELSPEFAIMGLVKVVGDLAYIVVDASIYDFHAIFYHELGHVKFGRWNGNRFDYASEYRADAYAAKLVGKQQMIRVLDKLCARLRKQNSYDGCFGYVQTIKELQSRINKLKYTQI